MTTLNNRQRPPRYTPTSSPFVELSVVMPCLNEVDTIASCVSAAMEALREHRISGEVIVADNGSTDGSQQLATSLGARVIQVSEKGYGSAASGQCGSPWGDEAKIFGTPFFTRLLRKQHLQASSSARFG